MLKAGIVLFEPAGYILADVERHRKPMQLIKDYFLTVVETELEQNLINNLQQFLLELGKGFAFVEHQQRIATKDQDFYLEVSAR